MDIQDMDIDLGTHSSIVLPHSLTVNLHGGSAVEGDVAD